MELIDLPEDVLVYLFKNFLNLNDLFVLSTICKRFYLILQNYKIWQKFKILYPIIDFSYPYGYEDSSYHR